MLCSETRFGFAGGRWASEVPVEGTEQPPREGYVFAVREEAAWLEAGDEKPEVVPPFNPTSILCQFCGRSYGEVRHLFQAKRKTRDPNTDAIAEVWICNQCVSRMAEVLAEDPPRTRGLWFWANWMPDGHKAL
jgi:ClpX C4-type zinc finger